MGQENNKKLNKLFEEFDSFVYAYFDGLMDEYQTEVLNQYLREEVYVGRLVELCRQDQLIYELMSFDEQTLGDIEAKVFSEFTGNESFLRDLIELEQNAPAIEIYEEEKNNIEIASEVIETKISTEKYIRLYNRAIYIAAVFMILFIVYAHVFPPKYSVEIATITDQLGVKWDTASAKLKTDERILTNQAPYTLEKGIIQITYDEGVDITIEGPAEFAVGNKGIDIAYGRLYSYVSDIGHGFTVDTPNNRFIDLGTEFGVFVDQSATSELHVFTGEVKYYSGLKGAAKVSKTIKANNARKFDTESGLAQVIPVEESAFAHHINSKTGLIWRGQKIIDLSSLFAGYGGFNFVDKIIAIDPLSGKYTSEARHNGKTNNNYNLVKASEYIDGVFVPQKSDNPDGIQITSSGHKFSCPVANGSFTHNILTFPTNDSIAETGIEPAVFDYSDPEKIKGPFILIHSNNGITFDVQKIMTLLPVVTGKLSFKSLAGLTMAADKTSKGIRIPYVDFRVFVDGKVRYEHLKLAVKDGLIDIDINLKPEDRFLTFMVTDAGDENGRINIDFANDFFYLIKPVFAFE